MVCNAASDRQSTNLFRRASDSLGEALWLLCWLRTVPVTRTASQSAFVNKTWQSAKRSGSDRVIWALFVSQGFARAY